MTDLGADCQPDVVAAIGDARRIWIGTHVDPDGDAYGSLLGLGLILRSLGKTVTLACQDPAPREVDFLPGLADVVAQPPTDVDLAIAVDAADCGRLGKLYRAEGWALLPTVVIDHHGSNPGFGRWNWVAPQAAATCQMLTALALREGWPIDRDTARCLLTGILTDTISFRTTNTTAGTLEAAAALLARGADLSDLSALIFGRLPMPGLRLIGRAIERLTVEGPFALTWLNEADLSDLGARPGDGKEVTRVISMAEEPRVVAILRDKGGGKVDLSLRAKPGVDLLAAAAALGGGGHPQAAGARLLCSLEEAKTRVLAALTAHVRLPVEGSTVPAADLGPADLGPADPKPTDLKPTAPTGDATVEGSA